MNLGHHEPISLCILQYAEYSVQEGFGMKTPDKRCCGSGVCIINDAGECWCGQVWDGEKMAAPSLNLKSKTSQDQNLSPEKPEPEPEPEL
jgi:hypothetical protein